MASPPNQGNYVSAPSTIDNVLGTLSTSVTDLLHTDAEIAKSTYYAIKDIPATVGKAATAVADYVTQKVSTPDTSISSDAFTSFQTQKKYQYQVLIISNRTTNNNSLPPVTSVRAYLPEKISLNVDAGYAMPGGDSGFFNSNNAADKIAHTIGFSGLVKEMSMKVWTTTSGIGISLPLVFVAGETLNGNNGDLITPILQLFGLNTPSQGFANSLIPPGPTVSLTKSLAQNLTNVGSAITGFVDNLTGQTRTPPAQPSNGTNTVAPAKGNVGTTLGTQPVPTTLQQFNAAAQNSQGSGDMVAFDNQISIYIGNFLYFPNVVITGVNPDFDMVLDANGIPIQATVSVSFETMFSPTIEDLYKIFYRNIAVNSSGGSSPSSAQTS